MGEKKAAEKAKAEKESQAAAHEAAAKLKELSDAVKAQEASAANLIQSDKEYADAVTRKNAATDAYQAALADHNTMTAHAHAEKEKMKKMLDDSLEAIAAAEAAKAEALRKQELQNTAYQVAQAKDDEQVKAVEKAAADLDSAQKLATAKTAEVKIACREAEAARKALSDAKSALTDAEELVRKRRDTKEHIWALYDRIEEFYDAASKLTKHMRTIEDECSKSARECLIADGPGGGRKQLKTVLEAYNTMVLEFMQIKELHKEIYADIEGARSEIDNNGMAQVLLSCDPYKELGDDPEKLCTDGLWPALGLNKNRFF